MAHAASHVCSARYMAQRTDDGVINHCIEKYKIQPRDRSTKLIIERLKFLIANNPEANNHHELIDAAFRSMSHIQKQEDQVLYERLLCQQLVYNANNEKEKEQVFFFLKQTESGNYGWNSGTLLKCVGIPILGFVMPAVVGFVASSIVGEARTIAFVRTWADIVYSVCMLALSSETVQFKLVNDVSRRFVGENVMLCLAQILANVLLQCVMQLLPNDLFYYWHKERNMSICKRVYYALMAYQPCSDAYTMLTEKSSERCAPICNIIPEDYVSISMHFFDLNRNCYDCKGGKNDTLGHIKIEKQQSKDTAHVFLSKDQADDAILSADDQILSDISKRSQNDVFSKGSSDFLKKFWNSSDKHNQERLFKLASEALQGGGLLASNDNGVPEDAHWAVASVAKKGVRPFLSKRVYDMANESERREAEACARGFETYSNDNLFKGCAKAFRDLARKYNYTEDELSDVWEKIHHRVEKWFKETADCGFVFDTIYQSIKSRISNKPNFNLEHEFDKVRKKYISGNYEDQYIMSENFLRLGDDNVIIDMGWHNEKNKPFEVGLQNLRSDLNRDQLAEVIVVRNAFLKPYNDSNDRFIRLMAGHYLNLYTQKKEQAV